MDETEKGWFIQYIDRDPETIERQKVHAVLTVTNRSTQWLRSHDFNKLPFLKCMVMQLIIIVTKM